MDLLRERRSVSLQEGIHILPVVQVSDTSDFSVNHRLSNITSAIAKDEALDVRGLDLAAMVDDISRQVDHGLSGVQAGEINLGVSERHEYIVLPYCFTNAAYLLRVRGETVLAMLLELWQTLLVVDLPCQVGVARNPCSS